MVTHFIVKDNKLYGYGRNNHGQLGIGKVDGYERKFVEIELHPNINQIKKIYKSIENTFILTNDGLYGCGNNEYNQLGHYTGLVVNFVKIPFDGNIIDVFPSIRYTIIHSTDGLYVTGRFCCGNIIYRRFTKIPFVYKILNVYVSIGCMLINSENGLYILGKLRESGFNDFTKLAIFGNVLNVICDEIDIIIHLDTGLFMLGVIDKSYITIKQFNLKNVESIQDVIYSCKHIIIKQNNKYYQISSHSFDERCKEHKEFIDGFTETPYKENDLIFKTYQHDIYEYHNNKITSLTPSIIRFFGDEMKLKPDEKLINITLAGLIHTTEGIYNKNGDKLFDVPDMFV